MDNDDLLFAATEVGPYAYSFNQSEWFFLSGVSGPDQTYWSVDFIPELNTARFGTYGRGIWDFILNENYNFAESKKMGRRYPHVWCLVHDQKEDRTRVLRGDYLKLLRKGKKSNYGQ